MAPKNTSTKLPKGKVETHGSSPRIAPPKPKGDGKPPGPPPKSASRA